MCAVGVPALFSGAPPPGGLTAGGCSAVSGPVPREQLRPTALFTLFAPARVDLPTTASATCSALCLARPFHFSVSNEEIASTLFSTGALAAARCVSFDLEDFWGDLEI